MQIIHGLTSSAFIHKMGRFSVVLLGLWLLTLGFSHAQTPNRCLTTEYESLRHTRSLRRENTEQFEQWMQSKLAIKSKSTTPTVASTYTIPVVVHVIHNGINDVTNISDAQILSQIDVLNKDFNRLNADVTETPSEFLPVAGSISMQFVLAKRDPEGRTTNGIVRVQGTKQQWSLSDQSEFKALSYWPAEDYLNIWVISFDSEDLGYAQFPVSNTLAGLEDASADRLTDGVVINYRAFGTKDAGTFPLLDRFDKGRTTTHEVGHFFGMRHIWGDGNSCSATDYVDDTPPQPTPTSFCPSNPVTVCDGHKMFQNYMDYTDDRCMNLFTVGQFGRVEVVLSESPRRTSLLTSLGATPPVPVANNLGIKEIITPGTAVCGSTVTPTITVRNYGTNVITSAQIRMSINGVVTETVGLPSSLQVEELIAISFSPATLPSPGNSLQVEFLIMQTNGGSDGNTDDDYATVNSTIPQSTTLPVNESFDSFPSSWTIQNPDNQITWTNVIAADNSPTNRAMKMDFYNYENEGVLDKILTPSFTMTTPENGQLKFDVAYAQFPGQINDGLKVYALPGCNPDLNQAILLYAKSGPNLATISNPTSNPFVPINLSQWRKPEVASLMGLTSVTTWQLAFVGHNGYGNNLYIDNIKISQTEISDIALLNVVSPSIVHCQSSPIIQFQVSNLGTSLVTSFKMEYTLNADATIIQQFNNLQLDVGETETFSLNAISLQPGTNNIKLKISLPNGIPDLVSNNSLNFITVFDQSFDKAPLRMTFDNPLEKSWRVASPVNFQDWKSVATNKENSLSYRSFTNPNIGQESWLVSPVLDLTVGQFTMFFDVSYAQNSPADDHLLILASTNCGLTYDKVLMDRAASSFSPTNSSIEWNPASNDDWRREFVNINDLTALSNVRIAFVARNDNGNNLYIDNIELFEGDDTNPPVTTAQYQFYYSSRFSTADISLTLHLDVRQDIPLQIFSMQGRIVEERVLYDALNQTYNFDLSSQAAGLYLFRMMIDGQPAVTKVFIGH